MPAFFLLELQLVQRALRLALSVLVPQPSVLRVPRAITFLGINVLNMGVLPLVKLARITPVNAHPVFLGISCVGLSPNQMPALHVPLAVLLVLTHTLVLFAILVELS